MSKLAPYRTSTESREILRILQKASPLPGNFIWQTHALGRNIVGINHFEIDFVSREVVVFFDHNRFRFDRELPIYVKLDYRDTVFKVTEYRLDTTLNFTLPKELKTLELRANPRHVFTPVQEKTIGLRATLSSSMKEHSSELHVRALDISEYGLGLLVSEQNRPFLKNNRILWITQLHDRPLQYPILAEVVYMNSEVDPKYSKRKQKEVKVGLKLSGVLPNDAVSQFIK